METLPLIDIHYFACMAMFLIELWGNKSKTFIYIVTNWYIACYVTAK